MRFEFLPEPHTLARPDDPETTPCPDPRRIIQLREHPSSEDEFWAAAAQSSTPLIDPGDAPEGQVYVTFIFRDVDERISRPAVMGAPLFSLDHFDEPLLLSRVTGTSTWYATIRARAGAVIAYGFVDADDRTGADGVPRPFALDPLCPEVYPSAALTFPPPEGWEDWTLSVARVEPTMKAVPAATPRGTVQVSTMPTIAHGDRRLFTYVPAGMEDEGPPRPWMLLFDGYLWASLVPLARTLDDLIHRGLVPPLVVVMMESLPSERGTELSDDPSFTEMLADEAVPWLRQHANLSADPAKTIISGQSYGGSQAFIAAHQHPDLFGNVLSQSGSFWLTQPTGTPGWIYASARESVGATPRIYLDVGLYEGVQLLVVRAFADVLKARGYDMRFVEYPGGHDFVSWHSFIADGLLWLTRDWREPDETT